MRTLIALLLLATTAAAQQADPNAGAVENLRRSGIDQRRTTLLNGIKMIHYAFARVLSGRVTCVTRSRMSNAVTVGCTVSKVARSSRQYALHAPRR